MSTERFLLLTALVVLATSFTRVASHSTLGIRRVDLDEAVNKSVCPIEVVIDDDPNRIPQRIKVMKCANESMSPCEAEKLPKHECCLTHDSHHKKTCVEMRDTVLVYYKDRKATTTYDVAVGCTCLVEQIKNVASVLESTTTGK